MEEQKKSKSSWWLTLPGILTGIAAIVTALTGLIIGLNQIGFFSNDSPTTQKYHDDDSSKNKGKDFQPESKIEKKSVEDSNYSQRTTTKDYNNTRQTIQHPKGMGILRTSKGEIVFDKIDGMSMSFGKLTVSQLGAKVEIPLDKIKLITFKGENIININYRNGQSEETEFFCYWNLPATFIAGDKKFYYGDCNDFQVVKQIEFFNTE